MLFNIFPRLLNMSITASWLVLAVIVLRLLLKKAPKAVFVAMWALVGIRLVCPFSIESVFSLIPSTETIPTEIYYAEGAQLHDNTVLNIISNPAYSNEVSLEINDSVNRTGLLTMYAYYAWLIGMAVMLLYTVISYARIHLKVREAVPLKDNIWLCDRIDTPFIFGVFSPRIFLPSAMSEQDAEYVIAHEKAHLKRRDHLWKPLGFLLLTVYWFNPVLWVAYSLLCRDIELACDEKVIKEIGNEIKKPYSQALINCSVQRKSIAACPLAFGETGVKGRIKSVLSYKKPAFWIVAVAVTVCVAAGVCFLTNPVTSSVSNITEQNGYMITEQTEKYILVNFLKENVPLPLSASDSREFSTGHITLYRSDTTVFYLSKVSTEINDGVEWVTLEFDFKYYTPSNGSVTVPYSVNINEDGSTEYKSSIYIDDYFSDMSETHYDSIYLRGTGPDEKICVNIRRDSFDSADTYIQFAIRGFYDLAYEKKSIFEKSESQNTAPVNKTTVENSTAANTDIIAPTQGSTKQHNKSDTATTVPSTTASHTDTVKSVVSPDAAVAYGGGNTRKSLYFSALNSDKMDISSVQHLPIFKFETLDELKKFKSSYGNDFTMEQGWNEVPSFNSITAGMDEAFFEKYTVFLVYVSSNSSSFRYGVNSVYNDGKNLCIHIEQTNNPELLEQLEAGWFITVPIEKEAVKNCTDFDADLNNLSD